MRVRLGLLAALLSVLVACGGDGKVPLSKGGPCDSRDAVALFDTAFRDAGLIDRQGDWKVGAAGPEASALPNLGKFVEALSLKCSAVMSYASPANEHRVLVVAWDDDAVGGIALATDLPIKPFERKTQIEVAGLGTVAGVELSSGTFAGFRANKRFAIVIARGRSLEQVAGAWSAR